MTKILIVEDDSDYLWVLIRKLSGFFDVRGVTTLAEAILEFAKDGFSAVLMDIALPDSVADMTVARMKQRHPHCAIVVLSGNEDPDRIKKCIQDSASNYLVKGRDDEDPEVLASAIRTAISSNNTCRKADAAHKTIEWLEK